MPPVPAWPRVVAGTLVVAAGLLAGLVAAGSWPMQLAVGTTVAALAGVVGTIVLWPARGELRDLRTCATAEDRFLATITDGSPQEAVAAAVEVLVPHGRLVAVHLEGDPPGVDGLSAVLVDDALSTGLPAVLPDGTTGRETAHRVALPIAVEGRRTGAVVLRLPGGSDAVVAGDTADVQRLLQRLGPLLASTTAVSRPPPPPAADPDGDLRELVARGAHDLRTPLNTLAGMVDTLVRHGDELPPETRDQLHAALQRSTRRVAGWITMLLDGAVDEGARTADRVPTPLQPLLEEAVTVTQAATVGLDVEVPTTDLYVFADPGSVVRVVGNLLANAGHHGGAGGRVEVAARARGREVEISVRDHGAGWGQAAPGGSSDSGSHRSGFGLGLASVRAQVTDWGGEVVLDETPGGGATVRFTLPRAHAGAGATSADGASSGNGGTGGGRGATGEPGATDGGNWTIAGRESLLRGRQRTHHTP